MTGPVLEGFAAAPARSAPRPFFVGMCALGLALLLSGAVLTLPFVMAFSGADPWTQVMRQGLPVVRWAAVLAAALALLARHRDRVAFEALVVAVLAYGSGEVFRACCVLAEGGSPVRAVSIAVGFGMPQTVVAVMTVAGHLGMWILMAATVRNRRTGDGQP